MIVKSIKAFLQNNKWWQFEQFICLYLKPGIKWGPPPLLLLFFLTDLPHWFTLGSGIRVSVLTLHGANSQEQTI